MSILNTFRRFNYLDRGLTLLLAVLLSATIGLALYLVYVVVSLRQLLNQGTSAATTTLILQDLEIELQAAESAQRGYIITGDTSYLQPYNSAVGVIAKEQKALAAQPYVLDKADRTNLNRLIAAKLKEIKLTITIRRDQGFAAALSQIKTNQGNELVTEIRSSISKLALEKIKPFEPSYKRSQSNLRLALFVSGIVVGFVFLICGVIMRYFERAIQKQRATEGTKNEFLSLASHQLRTPATNVKQYIGLLMEGYIGELTPEQTNALAIANKNNEMEINIINDLLGMAKLDLNKIQLNKKMLNVYDFTKEIVESYRDKAGEKKQTVRLVQSDKKATAPIDPVYIKSALENLLDNAHNYSPPKTHIYLEITSKPKKISIAVRDEGVGIKRAEMSKLFNKFSRLSDAHNSDVEGSGIGLYWVKRIVELHGGSISVKSKGGVGSTFTIELPVTA